MNLKPLIFIFLLSSCTGSLEPGELITWIEEPENGCVQESGQSAYKLLASILPPSLMAYKQLHILEERYDDSAFDALEKEYQKGVYFKFSIDFEDSSQQAKQFFEAHTDYLNFYMSRDLALVMGSDTLPCLVANLERSANFTPRLNYELAFEIGAELGQKPQDLILIYSGELSENKPVNFVFTAGAINDIPHLKR
ncbi:MAG TPA: hypothetical protein DIW47_12155 [Bacteroidetes bacterium]|nr:hypothetical protein [Bacteroidota bacterium]